MSANIVTPSKSPAIWRLFRTSSRLDARHHLLFGDEVIDSLQQSQQALHVAAPFVQDVIGVSGLGKAHDASRSVNLGVDRLGRDQLAYVLFRLILCQVEQLGEALHLDARVVLGNDADVVLDDTLPEILPSLVGLLIRRLAGLGVEDIGAGKVRTKFLSNLGPSHQLVDGEQSKKLGIEGDLRVASITVYAVEEIVLLVVVRGKDRKVDDALEDLSSD